MKNQIKQELKNMEAFMDADAQLTFEAGMDYDYEDICIENYKIIANRVGCTAEEVAAVHDEMNKQRLMDELISALNGDAYADAQNAFEGIRMTGDSELIAKAEYAMAVL